MLRIQTRHLRARYKRPDFQRGLRSWRKILPDLFFRLLATCYSQPRLRNDPKNLLKSCCQVINPFVVDPGSDEEKLGRNSTGEGSRVEELRTYTVWHQPHTVRRQIVFHLQEEQGFAV